MKFLFTKQNTKRGMTLVETFVAIAILMLSVVGPLTLSQRSLAAAYYAKDKMTAYYLAQDAVDHIRRLRDTNGLYGLPWTTDISECLNQGPCQVNTLTDPGLTLCGGSCPPLEFDTTRYMYGYNGGAWATSKYTRTVELTTITANEIAIVVTVSWRTSGFQSNSITVREHIFNWR